MVGPSGIAFITTGVIAVTAVLISIFFPKQRASHKEVYKSSSSIVGDAVSSLKESVDTLSSDRPIFGKSKSSSLSFGGSRRKCKKGGKRKTKTKGKR
jgi:hypothetical protein